MISTRVMDIKLREAAEGLGEDSAGEVRVFPGWGRAFGCGAGGEADRGDGAVGRGMSSPQRGQTQRPLVS